MRILTRVAAPLVAVMLVSGCGLTTRRATVQDVKYNPGRYQNRSVSIDGVVTSSWGIPLVPFKLYKVDDGTGEVTVVARGGLYAHARRARSRDGPRERNRDVRRLQRRPPHSGDRPRLQAVIRTATAVMSSFGGASPRHSATA